ICILFFFFQAEDGIRDFHVTGVQTCALPIFSARGQVTLSSASLETLLHVRDVANLLGIGTYAPTSKLRRGYGAEPTLIHEMGLSAADLSPSFFLRDDQRAAWRLPAQERFGWTVVSV